MSKENSTYPYVKPEKIYSLGKDTDGVLHNSEELHALLLEAVLELDRVCRKNDIPYALAYGSALGAYNYGGFIPWDDDVDIAIRYEDINRLVEACEKDLDKKYVFECYENNKKYNVLVPTGKLRLKETYFKEKNWFFLPNRCGTGQTFFIDIVAFMGVPEDHKEHCKLINKVKWDIVPYCFLDVFLRIHPMCIKKKLKKFEKKIAEKYKDSPMVSQTIIIPFQDMDKSFYDNAFPRDVIFPFREYDFCGHKLYSFNDLETFCRMRFSDKGLKKWDGEKYIDPYPESKRKFQHLNKYNFKRKEKK